MKLEPELIPKSSWFNNLRAYLTYEDWEKVRKFCFTRANNRCEICGEKDAFMECHEVWEYNQNTRVQTLVGVMALCHLCHQVKHIGRAKSNGSYFTATRHMAKVNGIEYKEAFKLINQAFTDWKWKSEKVWRVDFSEWLKFYSETTGDTGCQTNY